VPGWSPLRSLPEAAPVVSTVNAWEIEELEDESEEDDCLGASGRMIGLNPK
jgi:hypothetical protein